MAGAGGAATMTFVGTPYYLAPEIARGDRYDERCDVYSFGVVLLELACVRPGDSAGLNELLDGRSPMNVAKEIVSGWHGKNR